MLSTEDINVWEKFKQSVFRLNFGRKTEELPPRLKVRRTAPRPLSCCLDLHKMTLEEAYQQTKTLLIKLDAFEDVILAATKQRAPYMIAKYAQELANDFHKFYAVARVITDDKNLSSARVCLVIATKNILNTALKLLGVTSPEIM